MTQQLLSSTVLYTDLYDAESEDRSAVVNKTIDWTNEIEFKGFDPFDIKPTLLRIEEENGYVAIGIEYGAHGEYAGSEGLILGSHADYFDEICVGFVSGRPLNPFLSEDFSIINAQEE